MRNLRWLLGGFLAGAVLSVAPSCGQKCSESNCPGCCDEKGACQTGNVNGACGQGGSACAVCFGAQECAQGACSDPRCNLDNCKAMTTSCRVEFAGGPNYQTCRDAGTTPPDFDWNRYCPAQCNAGGTGALAQCLSDRAAECVQARDGGYAAVEAVVQKCLDANPSKAAAADCDAKCAADRKKCDGACSQASYQECMDCSAGCGVAQVRCTVACPRVP